MRLSDAFPSPKDFKENELKTLKFLSDDKIVGERFPLLQSDSRTSYHQYKASTTNTLSFETYLEASSQDDSKDRAIFFGVDIRANGSFKNLCYYIAVADSNDKSRIQRKYHFDFVPEGTQTRTPHPIHHMQYCGKRSALLEKHGCSINHMNPEVSQPRLSYLPMTLALVINLILLEYQCENTLRLLRDSQWRNLIKKNEKFVLETFFINCQKFIDMGEDGRKSSILHNKDLITTDLFYGS